MIPIRKGSTPPLLVRFRAIPGARYDGGMMPDGTTFTQVKQDIRIHLVCEQGYLCAYCMKRIKPTETDMKIEHWESQASNGQLQLDYQNMLGCCCGRSFMGGRPEDHCDTFRSRRNHPLLLNPSNPADYSRLRIRYRPDGEIGSGDSTFDGQLRTVLNLNASRLVANRKEIWERVTTVLSRMRGTATRREIEALKARWESKSGAGELPEYCGVAIQYLERRLAGMP